MNVDRKPRTPVLVSQWGITEVEGWRQHLQGQGVPGTPHVLTVSLAWPGQWYLLSLYFLC